MKLKRSLYVFSIILLISSGCARKSSNSSTVRFTTPANPNVLGKSVATLSSNNFCYFINVIGSDIAPIRNSCAPNQGLNSGFIPPSTSVEMSVPKGSGRTVELYGYIAPSGEACDSSRALSGVPLNRLFRMAKVDGIDMSANEVVVDLTSQFPGLSQHFGIQGALPVTCYAGLPAIPQEANDPISPVQTSASYVIKSASGATASASSSPSYKIKGVISHVVH